MSPTEQLKEEHVKITSMLEILGKVSDRLESGKHVEQRHLDQILEYLKVFVGECHHGKEEDALFPAMEQAGIGDPVEIMLEVHQLGRENVTGMSEAAGKLGQGDQSASSQFVQNARSYIERLLEHIEMENETLYPMADETLPGRVQIKLSVEFAKVDEERIGHGKKEEFHRLTEQLRDIYLA